MNDEELIINNLSKGSVEAFDSIYGEYRRKIYYTALGYLKVKEEAEDVMQKVFSDLWNKRGNLNIKVSLLSYLTVIARNYCIDSINKKVKVNKAEELFTQDFMCEEDVRAEIDSLFEKVSKKIDKLPPKCKEIFLLSYVKGLKHKEIAECIGVSVNTIKTQKKIAFKRIKESFIFIFF